MQHLVRTLHRLPQARWLLVSHRCVYLPKALADDRQNTSSHQNMMTQRYSSKTVSDDLHYHYEKKLSSTSRQEFLSPSRHANISKQKNSNIEIYYMVYILVSVILLLIEGSIILFK